MVLRLRIAPLADPRDRITHGIEQIFHDRALISDISNHPDSDLALLGIGCIAQNLTQPFLVLLGKPDEPFLNGAHFRIAREMMPLRCIIIGVAFPPLAHSLSPGFTEFPVGFGYSWGSETAESGGVRYSN